MTKGGSLGRSGIWKSLTLSRHDAAGPAIPPPAFSPSLWSPPPSAVAPDREPIAGQPTRPQDPIEEDKDSSEEEMD